MNKRICVILLALASSGAMAAGAKAWLAVLDDEESTTYAYPKSTRSEGDMAQMWSMVDYKASQNRAPAKAPFLSEKSEEEYDCRGKQFRTLYLALHPANMGAGPPVFTSSAAGKWQPVEAESDIDLLWNIACQKINSRLQRGG